MEETKAQKKQQTIEQTIAAYLAEWTQRVHTWEFEWLFFCGGLHTFERILNDFNSLKAKRTKWITFKKINYYYLISLQSIFITFELEISGIWRENKSERLQRNDW